MTEGQGGIVDRIRRIFHKEPEQIDPEKAVAEISRTTDKVLLGLNNELREPNRRRDKCGLSSGIAAHLAKRYGAKGYVFQAYLIAAHIGLNPNDSLAHGFAVIGFPSNNQYYLVDQSHCQFIDENGDVGRAVYYGGRVVSSGRREDHPIVETLLERGYTSLDDLNLRAYLRTLIDQTKHSELEKITVDEIIKNANQLSGPPHIRDLKIYDRLIDKYARS